MLFFITLSFSINRFLTLSTAQFDGDNLTFHSAFIFLEFGEDEGEILNTSNIEFVLPSSAWNLTDIELNFTDISYKREIFPIEDQVVGHSKLLNKGVRGYACQINITEPTEIYAIQIYADENQPATTTTITVQINGYDTISEQPNNTVYGSTIANISSETKWHTQNFSSPIFLDTGNYYLVLNGTEMLPSDKAKYYWHLNDVNPKNPNLYTWEYLGGMWTNNFTGEPFLYRFDQRVLSEFFPSDINLSAEIGENKFPIINGPVLGSGYLNLSLVYNPTVNFSIPITSNKSYGLIFNVSYNLKLKNELSTPGEAYITEDLGNLWTVTPTIERLFNQYYIKFYFPLSWHNFTVEVDNGSGWVNITSSIFLDDTLMLLPNDTIINEAIWRIKATSPRIDFSLNFPDHEWEAGQVLRFTVFAPAIEGNLTFVLVDPNGFGVNTSMLGFEVKEVTEAETEFSYEIPLNSIEGIYTVKLYWNNETDAGVEIEVYTLTLPIPPPPDLLPIILRATLITAVSVSAISITVIVSYRGVKRYKNRKAEESQKLYNQCIDSLNLDYIMISDKKSGLNVYNQNFSEKEVDAALISGFLQAIHTFGIELMKVEDSSQTIKLEYKDSIILMSEFVNIRLILKMKESPSRFFLYSVEELAYDIYKNYGADIDSFNGDVKPFKGIEVLLKRHLNASFIYPLKLAKIEKLSKVRISQNERELVNKAILLMKSKNLDQFYINSLLPGKECNLKDVENILNLFDKGIFQMA